MEERSSISSYFRRRIGEKEAWELISWSGMSLIIRSSAIHAAGCYTMAPIRKGARVVEYTGPRISKDDADVKYEHSPTTYLFGVGDGTTVIDGHGTAMFINHSCDPNCETEEIERAGVDHGHPQHRRGEELTYDYYLYDGDDDEARCNCGSANCRKSMYSPEEIRRRARAAKKKADSRQTPGRHRETQTDDAYDAGLKPATGAPLRSSLLRHFHDGEHLAVGQGQIDALAFNVAVAAIEGDTGQSGAHFEAGEAFGLSGLLAQLEDAGADAAPRPGGMNEEGANFGGVGARIEESVVAAGAMIAAVGRFAAGPAAAGREAATGVGAVRVIGRFDREVGAVGDQLRVETQPGAQAPDPSARASSPAPAARGRRPQ